MNDFDDLANRLMRQLVSGDAAHRGKTLPDDAIIVARNMGAIVDIQLERLERLLAERKISLRLDEAARQWLADKGYDPAYGARPLKRVIQKQVQDPLAEKILAGEIADGSVVKVLEGSDRLNFKPVAAANEDRAEEEAA